MTDTFACGHKRTRENTYPYMRGVCRRCRLAEIDDATRRHRAIRDATDPGWRERKAAAELFRKRVYNQRVWKILQTASLDDAPRPSSPEARLRALR
jgi:hypothetical protein